MHDAVSSAFIDGGGWHLEDMAARGAPWLSGEDDYAGLWREHGFNRADVLDLSYLTVDRRRRALTVERRVGAPRGALRHASVARAAPMRD